MLPLHPTSITSPCFACRVEGAARAALASEKAALSGALEAVAGWLAQLEAGCDVNELYAWEEDEEYEEEDEGLA